MNIKFKSIITCFLLISFCSCKKAEEKTTSEKNKKPNIVYILTDQWRSTAVGYAGNVDVKTPHLDTFAKKSVNFTNAVSVTPVCTPHRAALLTGRFPTSTGMILNDIYLPSEEITMAEIFKEAGYNTAYWGKWHLDGHGRSTYIPKERRQGFDFWKALECSHNYVKMPYYDNDNQELKHWKGYSPFAITADVNTYLEKHAKDENPFLAVVALATPHYPHHSAPKKYKDMYPPEKLTLNPNVPKRLEEKTRKELQGYYAHATATDEAIGNVLRKLKELNLMENTIIVFSADHGEMMGAQGIRPFVKQMAHRESSGVPFLIYQPKNDKNKGKIVNAPITTPDVLPTLLDLSAIKIPDFIEGENVADLVKNPNPDTDRVALMMNATPFASNFKQSEYRAIKTKQYTFIHHLKDENLLFDDVKDPYQMNNLYNNPDFKNVQKDLEEKLKSSLTSIGDEFHPREFYMKKYNYVFDKKKPAIPYWGFNDGNGKTKNIGGKKPIVQSPRPYKN
ncbi:sulfatase [uncultured Polaribacter sp.]|uniref:sulfatase family protein n=1 Tax=uncultured Polaribacter sp. TaxID=174711 RepID=UPI00260B3E0D|nr:sulfatase [uncultured Polaribacter sp.]